MNARERAEREKSWATRVYERRTALGLTQEQLAELVQVTQQLVSSIERGESIPRISTARRIAKALGTTIDELFPMSSAPDGED